jgi:hypothetical protein
VLKCSKDSTGQKVLAAETAYKQAIGLLTMHQHLSAEEKEFFQDLIDDFYETWDRPIWQRRNNK